MSTGYSLIMIHPKFQTQRQPVLQWVPQPDGSVMAMVDMSRGWMAQRTSGGSYLRLVPVQLDFALEQWDSVWGFLPDDVPLPEASQVREHVQGWARVRKREAAAA